MTNPGTDLDNVLARAELLGDHGVLYGSAARQGVARRPVRFTNIDQERFVTNIAHVSIPNVVNIMLTVL